MNVHLMIVVAVAYVDLLITSKNKVSPLIMAAIIDKIIVPLYCFLCAVFFCCVSSFVHPACGLFGVFLCILFAGCLFRIGKCKRANYFIIFIQRIISMCVVCPFFPLSLCFGWYFVLFSWNWNHMENMCIHVGHLFGQSLQFNIIIYKSITIYSTWMQYVMNLVVQPYRCIIRRKEKNNSNARTNSAIARLPAPRFMRLISTL